MTDGIKDILIFSYGCQHMCSPQHVSHSGHHNMQATVIGSPQYVSYWQWLTTTCESLGSGSPQHVSHWAAAHRNMWVTGQRLTNSSASEEQLENACWMKGCIKYVQWCLMGVIFLCVPSKRLLGAQRNFTLKDILFVNVMHTAVSLWVSGSGK